MRVKYSVFLEACRRKAKIASPKEFAAKLRRPKEHHYYLNLIKGVFDPGREVLEDAAKLAGFKLEDLLVIPGEEQQEDPALETFRDALQDFRRDYTLEQALQLERMQRPKRPKHGGRKRKQSEPPA